MSMAALKEEMQRRAAKATPRVRAYVPLLLKKVDDAGEAAGAWLEDLAARTDRLKPEGLMKGWTKQDFHSLRYVLEGNDMDESVSSRMRELLREG